jgi:hypothetical protein
MESFAGFGLALAKDAAGRRASGGSRRIVLVADSQVSAAALSRLSARQQHH